MTRGRQVSGDCRPAYLPGFGNDYTFASPQVAVPVPPIQVHLRTRCPRCQQEDMTQVMTFSIAMPPRFLTPPVRQLDPAASQEADAVVSRKKSCVEFKALVACFDKPSR